MLSPGEGDNTSRTLAAYAPAVREVCAGRATETEMRLLPHLLVSSLQSAFLRGGVFAGFSGMDFSDETQRDQLVDLIVYIVFHKYL